MTCGICQERVFCWNKYRCPETGRPPETRGMPHQSFHYSCIVNYDIHERINNRPGQCPMPGCNTLLDRLTRFEAIPGRFERAFNKIRNEPYLLAASGLISLGISKTVGLSAVGGTAAAAAFIGAIERTRLDFEAGATAVNEYEPNNPNHHVSLLKNAKEGNDIIQLAGRLIVGAIAGTSGSLSTPERAVLSGFIAGAGLFFAAHIARSAAIKILRRANVLEIIMHPGTAATAAIELRRDRLWDSVTEEYNDLLSSKPRIAIASVVAFSVLTSGGGFVLAAASGAASYLGTYLSRKLFGSD